MLLQAQPFASGPRNHVPSVGEAVDARLVFEDHEGYVWVSGPKGTFRYDGVRYLPATIFGLPAVEATQFEVTADGTLWILIDGQLWSRNRASGAGRFQPLGELRFEGMAAAGDKLYVLLPGGIPGAILGVLTRQTGLARTTQLPGNSRIVHQQHGGTWWLTTSEVVVRQRHVKAGQNGEVWYGTASALSWSGWDGARWTHGEVPVSPATDPLWQIVPVGNQDFLAADGHSIARYRLSRRGGATREALVASESRVQGDHIFSSEHGTWMLVNGTCIQLKPDGRIDYFRYAGPSHIYSLRAGKKVLWAAAGAAGLLSFSRERSVEWIQSYDSSVATAKAVARQGDRLLFGRTDLIYEIGAELRDWDFGLGLPTKVTGARWFGLPAASGPYQDAVFSPDGSVWQILAKVGALHLSARGEFIFTAAGHTAGRRLAQMRKLTFSDDHRLWVASTENLWEVIPGTTASPQPTYRAARNWTGPRYVADFVRDRRGFLYAVADHALLPYAGGRWSEQPWPGCLVDTRLRTAAIESDNSLWIAYRAAEAFTHAWRTDANQPWKCEHFAPAGGFPGTAQFLRFDRQGRLWRGDSAGVWVARGRERSKPSDWLHIGATEGLLAADMTSVFTEEPEGSMLVGVGHMLQHIPPGLVQASPDSPPDFSARAHGVTLQAIPENLVVNQGEDGSLLIAIPPAELPAALPSLEYRYDDGDWRPVTEYAVPLAEAPIDQSTVQVRFSGTGLSRSLAVRVVPVWWRGWPAQTAFISLLGLAAWSMRHWVSLAFYRLRKWRYMRRHAPPLAQSDPLPPLPDWPRGTLLRDRYVIDGVLARGGFSDIFAATDQELGNAVAIKRLRPLPLTPERSLSWLKNRFLREVGIVSLLQHPGIVPVIDTWFDDDGIPHMTLPRIYGLNLREYLAAYAPLSRERSTHFLRCIAETVAYAHERGVIHCDLKPENIMIPEPDVLGNVRPVIVDFGTSALHLQSAILSEQTIAAGSVRYMAPEQLLGRYSTASDIYAFAIMALELVAHTRYDQLELAIDEDWERNLSAQLKDRQLGEHTIALLVSALRWDPTQRPSVMLRWAEAFLDSI